MAENREVDVYGQRGVRGTWRGDMLCRQNELGYSRSDVRSNPALGQRVPRPIGASLLVVPSSRIINHVVQPERDLDLIRSFREVLCPIQFRQTDANVSQRMVESLGLGILARESIEREGRV